MKWLSVMIKSLKEQFRDMRGLALAVALPAAFMVIFGLAFGAGLPTIKVLYADEDGGEGGKTFARVVSEYRYADGKPMVELVPSPSEGLADRVKDGEAAAYIQVPPGFTERVRSGTITDGSALLVGGDPADANMRTASMFANDGVEDTIVAMTGRESPGRVHMAWIGEESTKTEFDWAAPGLMVFAIMLLVAQTAMIVVAEIQRGTLQRLRLTAMTAKDLFVGITGSQMVIATLQILFMLAVALALGYHYEGSLWFGVVLCIGLSLCAVGCGLVVACFARTPMEAANFGAGVLMPMVFLSGSMFPVPPVPLFEVGGHAISLWHILPPTHVVEAMRATLTYGRPWTESTFQLVATVVLSLGYLAVGIVLFQKVRMKTEY